MAVGGRPVPDPTETAALRAALDDAGTRLVGLNFYAGQLPGPDRGALSLPGAESERFRANVPVAVEFARSLGCTSFNALYGNRVEGVSAAEQDELALENLAFAARAVAEVDGTLLIEALNAPESPRCRSSRPPGDRGRGRGERGHRPGQRPVPDGPLPPVDERRGPARGHRPLHREDRACADRRQPGPRRPGTGDLDFADLLDRLAKAGYDGWTGLEYKPGDGPSAGAFAWLPAPLRAAS